MSATGPEPLLTRIAQAFARQRALTSRVFGVAFLALLFVSDNAHDGMPQRLMYVLGIVLVGFGALGRLWCAMYIEGRKANELATLGPYSMCRNPLYFYSFLGFAGIGFCTQTLTFGLGFTGLYLVLYLRVIKNEEQFLAGKFGQAFADYCARVPRFFPNFRLLQEPETWVVNAKRFRRAIGDNLWFVWFVGVLALIDALHQFGVVRPLLKLP